MTQIVDEPLESTRPRGNILMLVGGVIGLVSAAGLAYDGRVCGDVMHALLTARGFSEIVTLGQRLVLIGWCPLGVALGGTIVSVGLRRAARQRGLSRACLALIAVYGILTAAGAFQIWQGTSIVRTAFKVAATSETGIKGDQIARETAISVVLLSRGLMLLALAHVALLAGCVAQIVSRPGSASPSDHWPKTATVALIPLWLFGAIVSTAWIGYGLVFQEYANVSQVKASEVVGQISGVLSSGWVGSRLLMVHALLVTVVAGLAAVAARQSSSSGPQEDPVT